ncbi:MAG: ComF family protein [Candidatus Dactylopiibacterium sp.]|nr:ComF family protein [Candidatus Dactylopiibacterium sp.]
MLWPHSCFLCGGRSGALPLCGACAQGLPRLPAALCPICGLPASAGLPCGRCQRRPPAFDASFAAYVYASPLRELVLAFKHGQGFGLAPWFATAMGSALGICGADCVVPVPLHPRRMRSRGFNPACELSRRVAATLGLPHLPQAVLREVDTPHLAGLRSRARRSAVRGVFRCEADLTGRHVLLVDDVMTSGATLDALARCVRGRGAARVTTLVLARTLRVR